MNFVNHAPSLTYLLSLHGQAPRAFHAPTAAPVPIQYSRAESDFVCVTELNDRIKKKLEDVLRSCFHRRMELVSAIVLGDQVFQAMVKNDEPTNCPALRNVEGRLSSNKKNNQY
jgi:hypothetical protein